MDLQAIPITVGQLSSEESQFDVLQRLVGELRMPLVSQTDKFSILLKVEAALHKCSRKMVQKVLHKKKEIQLGKLLARMYSGTFGQENSIQVREMALKIERFSHLENDT